MVQKDNNKVERRGGARPNAGRKPSLEKQLQKKAELQVKLSESLRSGAGRVGAKYDEIIDTLIAIGLGGEQWYEDKDGSLRWGKRAPDRKVLTELAKLFPQMLYVEKEDDDSPIAKLLKEVRSGGTVSITQVNNYVESDKSDLENDDAERRTIVGRLTSSGVD